MPRDGSNIYTQPFPDVASATTIESAVYNGFTHDVELDLNTPRPIIAGGTGASSADDALLNLGAEKSGQEVTNFDSHPWVNGSFYANGGATGAPVAGHGFSGIVYRFDVNNIVVEARDWSDTTLPSRKYVREKKSGVWGGWTVDQSDEFVLKTGDTMSGNLTVAAGGVTLGGTNPTLAFQSAPGNQNTIAVYRGAGARWALILGNSEPESGGNAGSNFYLQSFNDAGAFLRNNIQLTRSTGDFTLDGNVQLSKANPVLTLNKTASGQDAYIQATKTGVTRWILNLGNTIAETGGNAGSDFALQGYADGGGYLGSYFTIERANGMGHFNGAGLSVGSAFYVGGQSTLMNTQFGNGAGTLDLRLTAGGGTAEGPRMWFSRGGADKWVMGPAAHILGTASDDFLIYSTAVGNIFRITHTSGLVGLNSLDVSNFTVLHCTANGVGYAGGSNIEVTSPAAGADAIMSFHRPGAFACNFGLGTDNNFYYGGWSFGAGVVYRFYTTRDGSFLLNSRLVYAADVIYTYGSGTQEPYGGSVVTGGTGTQGSMDHYKRHRYLQMLNTVGWFTIGYA